MRFPSSFLLAFLWLLSCNNHIVYGQMHGDIEDGGENFLAGIRLFQSGSYEEASQKFWVAVLRHEGHKHKNVYSSNQAFQNFLLCWQRQGKLALGYAFVALEMHKRNDIRSTQYLKVAFDMDPDNEEVHDIMKIMGETIESLLNSGRKYKPEEDEDDMEQNPNEEMSVLVAESCVSADQCQAHFAGESQSEQSLGGGLLVSGWDDNATAMYEATVQRLEQRSEMTVTIPPKLPFLVAYDPWWENVNSVLRWEKETFQIFERYIDSNTTVVDFGTWIGPTLLFHSQFSKKSYGIEADPVAYATVEHNVGLNTDKEWAKRIHLEPIAVSAPRDAGQLTMKSTGAGNSESSIAARVAGSGYSQQLEWTVNGYTLPYIFAYWGLVLSKDHPIFIKIDIESYECRLIPSFYDWFVNEPVLPTIFVSFHPQVEPCTKTQMMQVLQVFKLFGRVSCWDDIKVLPIRNETTFEEFEQMMDQASCLTQKENSDFVLSGRAWW